LIFLLNIQELDVYSNEVTLSTKIFSLEPRPPLPQIHYQRVLFKLRYFAQDMNVEVR